MDWAPLGSSTASGDIIEAEIIWEFPGHGAYKMALSQVCHLGGNI